MADCVPDKLPNLTWWVSGCPARCMIALEPDEWSHVVGTWDGATLHMYHNGVLADSVPYSPLTRTLTLTLTLTLALTLALALTRCPTC